MPAGKKLEHLAGYDHHAHIIESLREHPMSQLPDLIYEFFKDGARDQGLTDHSHNFVQYDVSFTDYIYQFRQAKKKLRRVHPEKTCRLGMELNGLYRRGKGTLDLETLTDPDKTPAERIIRALDFVIVSIHFVRYYKKNRQEFFTIPNRDAYFQCMMDMLKESLDLRSIKPGIPIILGHPGKDALKGKIPHLSAAQGEAVSEFLHEHSIIPEINLDELRKLDSPDHKKKYPDPEERLPVLSAYLSKIKKGRESPVSIGTDSHQLGSQGLIRWELLEPYTGFLQRGKIWCKE